MIFSPVIVVALSTLLVSPTLASPLVARQAASNSSSNVVDPHQAPDVPSNHTSPIAYGGVAWADAFSKAKALVEQMTVEEKSNITSGWVEVTFLFLFVPSLTHSVLASPASLGLARKSLFPLFPPLTLTFLPCPFDSGNTGTVARLGIPSFCFTDGPVGPRPVDLVTQFPAGVTVSATWDHDLFVLFCFPSLRHLDIDSRFLFLTQHLRTGSCDGSGVQRQGCQHRPRSRHVRSLERPCLLLSRL